MVIMYIEKLEGFSERICVYTVKIYITNTMTLKK